MYATTKRRQDEAVVTVETLAPLTGDWVAVLGTGAGACVSAGAGTGAGASAGGGEASVTTGKSPNI